MRTCSVLQVVETSVSMAPALLLLLGVLPLVTSNCIIGTHPIEAFSIKNPENTHRVWWDRLGTAEGDFSCYEPDLDKLSPGWHVLGHHPQPNHLPASSELFAFRECNDSVFATPVGFTRVWDDSGSTHIEDGSAWRPNCPIGYSRLSDFFYNANNIPDPKRLYKKVRCVHDDYVEDCAKGSIVWFYKGFPVSQSVSVWWTKPAATALGGSFLYANQQVDAPPGIQFRCLKKSAYVVQ